MRPALVWPAAVPFAGSADECSGSEWFTDHFGGACCHLGVHADPTHVAALVAWQGVCSGVRVGSAPSRLLPSGDVPSALAPHAGSTPVRWPGTAEARLGWTVVAFPGCP